MDYSVARLEDIAKWVQKNKRDRYTDFLSMGEQKILLKLIKQFDDINCRFDGGFEKAERKMAHIYPKFKNVEYETHIVLINAIRISGDLSKLSHRDVLGSILGLGIKRDKVGDIIKRQENCDVIVHNDIVCYILMNLNKIGKERVNVNSIELDEVIEPEIKYDDINTTVASIRLDSIVASGFKISRTKASELIKAGLAEVNWETKLEPSFEIKEGDIVSLRGHGRIKFEEIIGTTKKGRIYVHILKYK
ncbi:RNA-binding protein [Thermoanaerobacterium thermosaccharolyticum]|uniref:RNA-binding protein n=1 Tax=Thermoanaerobacterium thermosaccharolyticum TaxID=1517 RepID=A0A231VDV3_THETR|nr:YlmH/Sll1252 family protein [Thermoanaerobacterium thermosaccharolyticum]OXT06347.1 RNA-binding protein [Thermoanaerobacterium thermosaccharolyticum]